MLKGDLIKREGVWNVIYSSENIGKINEIELTDYSSRMLSEKKGDNIKYLQDVYFDITSDGMAAVKFFPDPPPTKKSKEGERPKTSKLREWIDEGCAMVQIEEQEKQKAIKESLDNGPFSTNEESTMNHLVSAYEEFSKLEQTNPNDIKDFVFHINALQRILGQRVLRKDYPNTFPTYK
jgi:hypothetical protein